MPISPARAAAFDILLRVERDAAYATELLHSATFADLSTQDHGLATQLVMGVLRWRSRLDSETAKHSSQPLAKLDLEILIAIRLALYQFRWLDRIPARAALHESVELVKRARKRSASAFVNAVLRKLLAEATHEAQTAKDPETLADEFAHSRWLVERWVKIYGFTTAKEICTYNQSVPETSIRLRGLEVESKICEQRIRLSAGRILKSARRVESGDVTKTDIFRAGQVVIQDEASQLIAALVGSASRDRSARILDCCAAPGGKTLAIADSNPDATIVAVELHPHRARLMRELLRRAQPHARIDVIAADATSLPISGHFDVILADVPCSGTGTLARNPEIKWRLTASDLAELHQRQIAILRAALDRLASGGRLVYSTCSLEREENEDVIEEVLKQDISVRLVNCQAELARLRSANELAWPDIESLTRGPFLRTIPGIHPCDGFFAATLERPVA